MTGNNMDNFTDDASPKAGVPTFSGAVERKRKRAKPLTRGERFFQAILDSDDPVEQIAMRACQVACPECPDTNWYTNADVYMEWARDTLMLVSRFVVFWQPISQWERTREREMRLVCHVDEDDAKTWVELIRCTDKQPPFDGATHWSRLPVPCGVSGAIPDQQVGTPAHAESPGDEVKQSEVQQSQYEAGEQAL